MRYHTKIEKYHTPDVTHKRQQQYTKTEHTIQSPAANIQQPMDRQHQNNQLKVHTRNFGEQK